MNRQLKEEAPVIAGASNYTAIEVSICNRAEDSVKY